MKQLSLLLASTLLLLFFPLDSYAVRYFAKPLSSGTADGLSWANARTLQGALDVAISGDEIWVMSGNYDPTKDISGNASPTDMRTRTFFIPSGVIVYGGFAGTETMISQRGNLFTANITTLRGNSGNVISSGIGGSVYHVVTFQNAASTTRLNGVRIAYGNANGTTSGTSLTVNNGAANVSIDAQQAGGGIFNTVTGAGTSSPLIDSCTITLNGAYYGGGVFNQGTGGTCAPTFRRCIIGQNATTSSNTIGMGNGAAVAGGGMYNNGASGVSLSACIFSYNNNSVSITDSDITGAALPVNINGGGLFNNGSTVNVHNCVFVRNNSTNAGGIGGGLLNNGGTLSVVHCTFMDNYAANGNGIRVASGTATIQNSVLWAFYTTPSQVISGTVTVQSTIASSGGNFSNNPGTLYQTNNNTFADLAGSDNLWFTSDDAIGLQCNYSGGGTIALNNGNSTYTTAAGLTTDLLGNVRSMGSNPDMGAYERYAPSGSVLYVNTAATGANNGLTWTDAFKELSDALNNSCTGASVWVAQGTYYPKINTNGVYTTSRSQYFNVTAGVSLYGGFVGGEALLTSRPSPYATTTLSGDIGTAGVAGDNTHHVLQYTGTITSYAATVLEGFVIRDGTATGGTSAQRRGGGVYLDAATSGFFCNPTIRNCVFLNNIAGNIVGATVNTLGGGGIFCDALAGGTCNPTIENCAFIGNVGSSRSTSTVATTNFTGGGAIYVGGNGGISCAPTIRGCTFYNNRATNTSGTNGALARGGAIMQNNGATAFTATVTNCIFWGNTAANSSAVVGTASATTSISSIFTSSVSTAVTATFSDIEQSSGTYTGTGNLNTDPLFTLTTLPTDVDGVDNVYATADDGLTLSSCSPCIAAGTNSGVSSFDILNATRIQQTTVDMGAYESAFVTTPKTAVIAGTTTICSGNSTNLTITITGGTSPYTAIYYDGTSNTTVSGYTSAANISVSPTATTTYTLPTTTSPWSVTDANGCTVPVSGLSGAAVVSVNGISSAPTAITSTAGNTLCSGSTATTLGITGGSLGAGATWRWYTVSCGGTAAGSGTTLAVNPASTTTYFVRAEGTCNTTACASQAITVNPIPSAGTITGTVNICENATSTLSSSGLAGGTWSSNATGVATVEAATGVVTPVSGGSAVITYTVTASGCSNAANTTVTIAGVTAPAAILNTPGSLRIADKECTVAGWTYYYDMSNGGELLLALNKNTNDIGSVGDGTFTLKVGMPNNPDDAQDLTSSAYITAAGGTSWVVMNRYWDIIPTTQPSVSAPISVRFYYRSIDFAEVNEGLVARSAGTMAAPAEMIFYKIVGGSPFPWANHTSLPLSGIQTYISGASASLTTWVSGTTSNGYPYAAYQVTSFSGGGGGGGGGVILPESELAVLASGELNESGAKATATVTWTPKNDADYTAYEVQRMDANGTYQAIGNVANGATSYTFEDTALPSSMFTFRYRVVASAIDGTRYYSNVVELSTVKSGKFSVQAYPNPAQDAFYVQLGGGWQEPSITLVNAIGQVIALPANTEKIDASSLSAGVYLLRVQEGERVQTVSIVIAR